jgi:hypothetical protein
LSEKGNLQNLLYALKAPEIRSFRGKKEADLNQAAF